MRKDTHPAIMELDDRDNSSFFKCDDTQRTTKHCGYTRKGITYPCPESWLSAMLSEERESYRQCQSMSEGLEAIQTIHLRDEAWPVWLKHKQWIPDEVQ